MKKSTTCFLCVILSLIVSAIAGELHAATVTARATGNWNTASTWIKTLTGTAASGSNSTTITGTGTLFTTELANNDVILLTDGTLLGTVSSIQSNTSLTLTANAPNNKSGSYGKEAVPGSSDDVVINGAFTVTLDITTTCVTLTRGCPRLSGDLS